MFNLNPLRDRLDHVLDQFDSLHSKIDQAECDREQIIHILEREKRLKLANNKKLSDIEKKLEGILLTIKNV